MTPSPFERFFMQPLDIRLELVAIDPPDSSTTDLYRRETPGSHQRVHLRDAHAEIGSDVIEGQKTRLDLCLRALIGRIVLRHRPNLTVGHVEFLDLAFVCAHLTLSRTWRWR